MSTVPSPPEPGSDEVALLIRLLKLGSFINSPMKDGVCDPAGVSQLETKVMMALAGEGPLAGHDLVEITGMPPMNISRAIAGLRERGWVEDTVDPDNRRRKPVRLTKAGEARYAALGPDLEAVAKALLAGLGTRQRREMAGIADRIIANMADWITSHHADVKLRS